MTRNSKDLIDNDRGLSIISVLVAAAIGIVVFTSIISMITNVFKSQRAVQAKDAERELVGSIRKILSDPTICAASFGGSAPAGAGFSKTQITDGAVPPNIKYQTGVKYLNNLVQIVDFQVKNFSAYNPTVNPSLGKAELLITMSKIGSTIGSDQMSSIIYLQATINGAGNITQCYALGSADSLWQISPTNMTDIYYSGGKVGIGTDSPICSLHVFKDAQLIGETPAIFDAGGSNQIINTLSGPFQGCFSGGSTGAGGKAFLCIGRTSNAALTGSEVIQSSYAGNTGAPLVLNPYGGNVGIGLTNPAFRLHVGGGQLVITDNGSAAAPALGVGDNNTGIFRTGAGQDMGFSTNGAERVRIDTAGRVGIGTNNPAATLDVKNGRIHGQLNCRKVAGVPGTNGSTAFCAADEYVISGGGRCETIPNINPGFLHQSEPTDDLSGWSIDCYKWNWTTDNIASAYAVCCKK